MDLIRRIIAGRLDGLADPQSRRALVIELFRQLAVLDFESLYASPGWRTYLALHATFLSLTDGGLRDQVQAALAQAEQNHLARVARAWELMAGLLGYRLRAASGVTFETLATLVNATMLGLVMTALTVPDVTRHRTAAQPFETADASEWSLPALGLGAIATAFLEPDPDFTWDGERAAAISDALRSHTASGLRWEVLTWLSQQLVGGVGHRRLAADADADLAVQPDAATWLEASDAGAAEEDRRELPG
jgi:hypothetical protein